MNHRARADNAYVEGDEDGFHLIVETDEGDHFNFNIHGFVHEFDANVRETIGTWLTEGLRASYSPRVTEDDLEGYDLSDPKRVEIQRAIDRGGQ